MTQRLKALAACLAMAASSTGAAIQTGEHGGAVALRVAQGELVSLGTRVSGEPRAAERSPAASSSDRGGAAGRDLGPAAEHHVPVTVLPIPEPGKWAVLFAGLLGVGAIARRRMSS